MHKKERTRFFFFFCYGSLLSCTVFFIDWILADLPAWNFLKATATILTWADSDVRLNKGFRIYMQHPPDRVGEAIPRLNNQAALLCIR